MRITDNEPLKSYDPLLPALRGAASGRPGTPLGAYLVTVAVGWKEKVVLPVQSPEVHFLSATILATIVPEIMVSIPLRVICLLTENRDNIKGGVLKDV